MLGLEPGSFEPPSQGSKQHAVSSLLSLTADPVAGREACRYPFADGENKSRKVVCSGQICGIGVGPELGILFGALAASGCSGQAKDTKGPSLVVSIVSDSQCRRPGSILIEEELVSHTATLK